MWRNVAKCGEKYGKNGRASRMVPLYGSPQNMYRTSTHYVKSRIFLGQNEGMSSDTSDIQDNTNSSGQKIETTGEVDVTAPQTTEQAVFAAGCFWCVEAIMQQVRGVVSVESGYIGGHTVNPSYREVCAGTTGHAEAVRVFFDPAVVSYRDLLVLFFASHDPTTLNKQGADVGTQYRSALFPLSDVQQQEARDVLQELEETQVFEQPIVTSIESATMFYTAETEHQNFYTLHGATHAYCRAVIAPKLAKLQHNYSEKLITKPVSVS